MFDVFSGLWVALAICLLPFAGFWVARTKPSSLAWPRYVTPTEFEFRAASCEFRVRVPSSPLSVYE